MAGHVRHHGLSVLPGGRRPVGRVGGLLCERMAGLLAGFCGLLLLRRRESGGANIRLPRRRGVAGFGEALFGCLKLGFELLELGCFGCEGLLSVREGQRDGRDPY